MSDVTVIGLGAMGKAIANAFMNAGHATTVWNRSAGKMEPLRISGAICADRPGDAVAASPLTIVCIDDYTATRDLFEEHGLGRKLAGRTLVQFSTGTPKEARDFAAGAKLHGMAYLDGAILAYPREIGHDGIIALSGDAGAYAGAEGLLAALSTDIRYLGATVGAAAALDLALLTYTLTTHLGLVHAALICESEQVSADELAAVVVDSQPSDAEEIRHLGQALMTNDFANPGASIGVYSGVLDRLLAQAEDAGIDATIPLFANDLYKRGMAAGLADEEVVALIKLLRR